MKKLFYIVFICLISCREKPNYDLEKDYCGWRVENIYKYGGDIHFDICNGKEYKNITVSEYIKLKYLLGDTICKMSTKEKEFNKLTEKAKRIGQLKKRISGGE